MEAIGQISMISKLVFPVLALVALYYLYKFLFSASGFEGKTVVNGIKDANPDKSYITLGEQLPTIYEGGEYTINGWIYINDYSINRGRNKHVFSIGGSSFLTLAVFLGPYKNSLNVRVHTRVAGPGTVVSAPSAPSPSNTEVDLSVANLNSMFEQLQQDTSLISANRPCDISSVDLQKWIQVTVVLNNKTCDVYMDGKLARSCILPSFYKVDRSNLTLRVAEYGGFGGFVSNVSAYNYALNPEQIWSLYMSGPGPQYGLGDYLKSLFDPSALGSFEYPKKNITA
jgi:hypothetical protein